jgi:hypothetical protein
MILGVSPETAKKFHEHWTPEDGIAIFLKPHHYEFSAAFANFVLERFIAQAQAGAKAALARNAVQADPEQVVIQI